MVKLALAYLGVASWAAATVIHFIGPTAQGVVLAAAVVGALIYLWRNAVVPIVRFSRRIAQGLDALFELADWRHEVDQRLARIEQKTEADLSVVTRVRRSRPH